MSVLSQLLAEAIANSRSIADSSVVMSQPEKDRVAFSFNQVPHFAVVLTERERIRIEAALHMAYGGSTGDLRLTEFEPLHKKFAA